MNDTSRQSASGTTEQDEPVEDGSHHGSLVTYRGPVSKDSILMRVHLVNDLEFRLWEFRAKLRHLIGRHTWVDIEDWSQDTDITVVTIIGQGCWLCPARK